MSGLHTYKVFISHAWAYNEDYHRLVEMLDTMPAFRWENLSVPEHDPVGSDTLETTEYELRNQMRPAEVFVVLAGMYAHFSDWIDFEIAFARRIGTPIVGVVPWGAQKTPVVVQDAAIDLVGWNAHSIVSAIRTYARYD